MTNQPSAELNQVARSGSANIVGAVINGLASILLTIAIAELLTKEMQGRFFALTSVFLITLAITELGSPTGIAKWIPTYRASGRKSELRKLLSAALLPVLVASTAAALLLWPLSEPILDWVARTQPHKPGASLEATPDMVAALRLIALVLPLAALYDVLLAASRGFGQIRPTIMVERLSRIPGQFVLVLVALLAGASITVITVAWVLPYIPALAAIIWFALRALRKAEHDQLNELNASPADTMPVPVTAVADVSVSREYWAFTWARGLSRIFQVVLQRLDIILVSIFLGYQWAGVYGIATRLVPVGLLGVEAVQQVLQPHLSKVLTLGQFREANDLYTATTIWSTIMAWPVYLSGYLYAPQIMELLNNTGTPVPSEAVEAMRILCATMLLATAAGPADMALLMAGRSQMSLANTTLALATNVTLNLLLIPKMGITGAAVAWAAAIFLTNFLPIMQLRFFYRLSPFSLGFGIAMAVPLLIFGLFSFVARRFLQTTELLPHALWLTIAVLLYVGLLYQVRSLVRLDVVASALRRKGKKKPA